MPAQHYHEIRKLGDLIRDVRICMLTTIDENGHLHSRPMATQQVEFDGDLWFFTGKSTHKTKEVERERRVNVSFANPDKQHYISVSGTAECVDDEVKAKQLWNDAYRAWFPKGLNDPDLTLMKVKAEQAEYWETPTSGMVQLLGLKRPEAPEHEKIDLKP